LSGGVIDRRQDAESSRKSKEPAGCRRYIKPLDNVLVGGVDGAGFGVSGRYALALMAVF
jgi:hypothetical protein